MYMLKSVIIKMLKMKETYNAVTKYHTLEQTK